MGCIVSLVTCCFCSASASCCCACLPSCRNSTSARIMFTIILVLTTLLSAIALIPEVHNWLAKIPALCTPFQLSHTSVKTEALLNCDLITGFGAVYRLCFGTVMFYFAFTIIMIRVRSSEEWRSKLQNGFWFFKFLFWFLLVVAAFFIPVEGFTQAWMVIGMIGASLFIFIQLVLLIDFAHSWNEAWISRYEENNNRLYACGLVSTTIGFYILSGVGVGLLYHFYAGSSQCILNQAMLSVNLILCIALSVISMLPQIREYQVSSGLLQSSVVTLYVIFLTWSAFSNGLDPACNPTMYLTPPDNATQPDGGGTVCLSLSWQVAFGVIILLVSVIYSAIKTSFSSTASRLTVSGNVEKTSIDPPSWVAANSSGNKNQQVVWDDETDEVTYVYSLFHGLLLLATLYVMMMLTNWLRPQNDLKAIVGNQPSYWVRLTTSWVCQGLYGWSMVAPMVFPDRF